MGLRSKGFYATVWEVRQGNGNYAEMRISTSKKDPNDNSKYITDYSGFVRCVGRAKEIALGLKEKDRIYVKEFELTNSYNKEKNTTYYNVAIFDLCSADDVRNGNSNDRTPNTDSKNSSSGDGFMNVPEGVGDEGLPFD